MANSNRKLILNYIRDTTLAQITTGNGYNTDVQHIKRGLEEIDKLPVSGFPALYVAKSSEDRSNLTRNQFFSRMQVVIIGYVKNATGTDGLQANMDELIEDVTKAFETDRTLGGSLAKWLEIKNVTTDDGDMLPYGAFAMLVEVVYTTEGITP